MGFIRTNKPLNTKLLLIIFFLIRQNKFEKLFTINIIAAAKGQWPKWCFKACKDKKIYKGIPMLSTAAGVL